MSHMFLSLGWWVCGVLSCLLALSIARKNYP